MNNKGKYIGISNRIPLVVLEYAVSDYISTGQINSEDYLSYIKEFTIGENRANKSLNQLVLILKKNIQLLDLVSLRTNRNFTSLSQNDQMGLLVCMFALTFPIAYDILIAFSTVFKIQDVISKRVILEKMGSMYGSNRAMIIGVDETVPLFIDIKLISRKKVGLYSKGKKLTISNNLISELIIYTGIILSGSKSLLVEDIIFKPWFSFFDIPDESNISYNQLISRQDSSVGKGYITFKTK
jgi:hypothetical protein